MAVTVKACESQIVLASFSTMLFTDDMINLKSVARILLMYQAVFTKKFCSLPDECPQDSRYISSAHRTYVLGRYCRARAFAKRMMCSS